MSEWRGIVTDMEVEHGPVSPASEKRKSGTIKHREVGLKHKNGQVIRLNDNGTIDAFAGPQLGIRLDPRNNSVNVIGDTFNVFSDRFNIKTRHYGLSWNGKLFDPETLKDSDMMTDKDQRTYHSESLMDMMESMGIDTYRMEGER